MNADQLEEPLFEVIEDLAPADLYDAASKVCAGGNWVFGHNSNPGDTAIFWKMDLTGDPVFSTIWQQAKARCETLAGAPLRIIRQYANGHTYGLGGRMHSDDVRPGAFTLLYYPMPEWKDEWEGETVFQDSRGDIGAAVRPRPNRAVLFDSRIPHAGRAPSRSCHALRVTVAYKLEIAHLESEAAVSALSSSRPVNGIRTVEVEREGSRRAYQVHVPGAHFAALTAESLTEKAATIRLPGFRPGRIPAKIMEQRYGATTRAEVANRLAAEAADRIYGSGGLASAIESGGVPESGDFEFRIVVTHLPDLPDVHFAGFTLERLSASKADIETAGLTAGAAEELFAANLRQQALDHLDAAYSFTVAPSLVEKEFALILRAAEAQLGAEPEDMETRTAIAAELHVIAERRVRLGAVVAELARRFEIGLTQPEITGRRLEGETEAQTRARLVEDKVVERLIANAPVSGRVMSADELRELAES